MKNVAINTLTHDGHTIEVSDLYGQGFNPLAQKWDFVTTTGNHFNYALEQKHAVRLNNAFSPDILGEIQKLQKADAVLFFAPIWWFSVPAILKGWFDRILAMGIAWDTGKIYENGLLRGKQAMLIANAGHPGDYYQQSARHGATMTQVLHPINHGTLAFCGLNVHEPFVAMNTLGTNDEGRAQMLKDLEFRLQNMFTSPEWLTYYG
jgi:NAD(P)H dehydrogenase (quinone)